MNVLYSNLYFGNCIEVPHNTPMPKQGSCYAPLWQQVINWFRIVHTIDIVYIPSIGWMVQTYNKSLDKFIFDNENYNESKEQAILKAIELI